MARTSRGHHSSVVASGDRGGDGETNFVAKIVVRWRKQSEAQDGCERGWRCRDAEMDRQEIESEVQECKVK